MSISSHIKLTISAGMGISDFYVNKTFYPPNRKIFTYELYTARKCKEVRGEGDKREEETELIFTFSLFHQFQFAGRPRGLTLQTINFSNIKLSGK